MSKKMALVVYAQQEILSLRKLLAEKVREENATLRKRLGLE